MTFQIDPQFEKDSNFILDLPLCHVRISHNAAFPWIILIPRVEGMVEIIDLDEAQQDQLLKEIRAASHVMKDLYKADKLNVANLGNMTPQLHIHVIARFKGDAAWPGPIWNSGQSATYQGDAMPVEMDKIKASFAGKL